LAQRRGFCYANAIGLSDANCLYELSYKTADNQKASPMRKLDIHDRVELARFAIREGWVAPV